ncbi:hypothetical protein IF1G_10797 [Cordyceps javanica]|uniref:Transmembrane protein n=1 Tax=Cordyceps javanica TaxID=43265 RepID=A0A545ULY2_9HYPO|nr:hypothetical protein IF1G_10797 [Cordyceps javanica]
MFAPASIVVCDLIQMAQPQQTMDTATSRQASGSRQIQPRRPRNLPPEECVDDQLLAVANQGRSRDHSSSLSKSDHVLMYRPIGKSVEVRLCMLFFVIIDVMLATINCFNARSALSIASQALPHDHDDPLLLAIQMQNFTSLGVPGATITTAVVYFIHAITGLLFVCFSKKDLIWITYVYLQFVLALILVSVGGFIVVRIAPYRMLFENYYGSSSELYYHVMYYGCIAEIVYGGLVMVVPLAIIGTSADLSVSMGTRRAASAIFEYKMYLEFTWLPIEHLQGNAAVAKDELVDFSSSDTRRTTGSAELYPRSSIGLKKSVTGGAKIA